LFEFLVYIFGPAPSSGRSCRERSRSSSGVIPVVFKTFLGLRSALRELPFMIEKPVLLKALLVGTLSIFI
jgi:hypothetical protein